MKKKDLRCCGNCKKLSEGTTYDLDKGSNFKFYRCLHYDTNKNPHYVCPHWQYDNYLKEDRYK